jgi:Raf kinase inhibitor-like YbhB/YbcL family protein
MTLISKHRLERSCSEVLDVVLGICHQHLFYWVMPARQEHAPQTDAEARKRTVLTGGVEQDRRGIGGRYRQAVCPLGLEAAPGGLMGLLCSCQPNLRATRGTKFRHSSPDGRMASHLFRLGRVFRLAGILIATEILLSLPGSAAMAMILTSPAFKQNGQIPSKYTCEGYDISPPLAWDGVPEGAKSLVLIIDDPDAPDPKAPQRVWVHWVVYNIPPDVKGLPENASKAGLPQGTVVGLNDFKKTEYGGPCPPIGQHRYFHKLYALDITLDLKRATKSQIEQAMKGHVLANAELIGTYQKGGR